MAAAGGVRAEYRAGGALLAWLTAAAVAIALLTFTGAGIAAALSPRELAGLGVRDGRVGICRCCYRCRCRRAPWSRCCAGRWWESSFIWPRCRAPGAQPADRVYFLGIDTLPTPTPGSSSPPSTKRPSSATSSPTFARSSTTWCAWTTVAATTPAISRCGPAPRGAPSGQPGPGRGHPDRRRVRPHTTRGAVFATFDADGQHRVKDVCPR